ncbi:uncharacterized protein LOC108481475 [Gossypium arboreum]|uniref:uncharacterized protein LOC108481475 n=1 Tax=Gossypium arboreum TaxID=29729 RepID=UPI00081932E5|nr:uncharacterized protein LOC108481475 [Gossypium arboreum]
MSKGRKEARAAFFEMMDEWFGDYLRNCPNIPRPPPPPARLEGEVPQGMAPVRIGKASMDKFRKYGAEEFRARVEDDAERAEFWLENTVRVLDELSCTPEECLKCAISLLKDTAYHCQRFLDWKRKEFLELKQGNKTVLEYERDFVRLSQYAADWVQLETEMYKLFEEGLNEEIKLLIGILEIREFAALANWAKKAEELNN